MGRGILLLLTLAIVAGCSGHAPADPSIAHETTPGASLEVLVVDLEERPLSAAWVFVRDAGRSLQTGDDGIATFVDLPSGEYNANASHSGFLPKDATVRLPAEGVARIKIQLDARPPDDAFEYAAGYAPGSCHQELGSPRPDDCLTPDSQTPTLTPGSGLRVPLGKPGLHNASIEIAWQGEPSTLTFEVGVQNASAPGTWVPFADGSLNRTLHGASPLRTDVTVADVTSALKMPGLTIVAHGHAPPDAPDQFSVRVSLGVLSTRSLKNASIAERTHPQEVGNATVKFAEAGAGARSWTFAADDRLQTYIVRVESVQSCSTAQSTQGAAWELHDPSGRTLRMVIPPSDGLCSPLATSKATFQQVLWDRTGVWTVDTNGACACTATVRLLSFPSF